MSNRFGYLHYLFWSVLPAQAFTTSGLRRALTNAVNAGLAAHELDTLAPQNRKQQHDRSHTCSCRCSSVPVPQAKVTKWKHQGYRQVDRTKGLQ